MITSLRAESRRPHQRLLVVALSAVLAAGGLAATTTPTASAAPTPSAAAAAVAAPQAPAAQPAASPAAKKKKKKGWSPKRGPIFNSPLGRPKVKYRIHDQIVTAIRKARRGSTVKIMSWNVMSRSAVDALLRAQKRGVRIRVLMDNDNATEVPNPQWRRLRTGIAKQNRSLKPARRAYAKTCKSSCRGKRGQAHAKFFLFSHTGSAKRVTMHGSANLTQAAATNQWNDLYTIIGNKKVFRFTSKVFQEMWRDRPVRSPFTELKTGNLHLYFSPMLGKTYRGDPYHKLLRQVRCVGARKGAGNAKGRTIIRVAPDVMRNERGMRAARAFKDLYNRGCDVKIGYTVMGVDIFRFLKKKTGRGPVPIRHLVQDFNGDKVFDNYFHLKALTINGRVGNDRQAYYTVNGSSNLSGWATVSDENISIVKGRGVTRKYQRHIDYWYNNLPNHAPAAPINPRLMARTGFDPYANVDMD